MPEATTAILPVRDFNGMTRLESVLTSAERAALIHELCERSAEAVLRTDLQAVVVSSSPDVLRWADSRGLGSLPDSGQGLSRSVQDTVASLGGSPWIVLHTDLPNVTPNSLTLIAELATRRPVLVPSHDGGTNVIASSGSFPFSYGRGSFHRHFAAVPEAAIVSNVNLSIDIDGPLQLAVFPDLVEGVGSHHGIEYL